VVERVLLSLRALPCEAEVILVDDGSTHGTREVGGRVERLHEGLVRTVSSASNSGKGAAIRARLKVASGELLLIQDAEFPKAR
jgi:glycosyltransferase involved in cell wall biosynthesis